MFLKQYIVAPLSIGVYINRWKIVTCSHILWNFDFGRYLHPLEEIISILFICGDFSAGLMMIFFLFQSHVEDVLHNILLQSIHHHEADRKQVKQTADDWVCWLM